MYFYLSRRNGLTSECCGWERYGMGTYLISIPYPLSSINPGSAIRPFLVSKTHEGMSEMERESNG